MIIYQASNENGLQSFRTFREAKEHIRAQELPGVVYRLDVEITAENMMRAIDQTGGYASDVEQVWSW